MSAVRGEGRRWTELWPADLHLIGKEIVRFHAIFWPAFLMAADLPLPKRIFAHGWLLFENDKMSKSRGNIVRAEPIRQVMGVDALRYFLLREIVFGQDGSFSYDALIGRYNSELANGLGNLASRTLTMIQQYRGGVSPAGNAQQIQNSRPAKRSIRPPTRFDRFEFSKGLEAIWTLLSAVDKFIVEQAPWKLAKKQDRSRSANSIGRSTRPPKPCALPQLCFRPILPESCAKIWTQLGMPEPLESVRLDSLAWGQLRAGQKIGADRRRLSAHRRQTRHRENARARSAGFSRAGRAAGQGPDPQPPGPHPPARKSPSTISPKSICAWARCSPPSASRAPTSCCT